MKKLNYLLILLLIISCQKIENQEPDKHQEPVGPEIIEIISEMGYDASVIDQNDDYYIVEEDILIRKEIIEEYLSLPSRSYYYYGNSKLLSDAKASKVRVYMDDEISQKYANSLTAAIEGWNRLNANHAVKLKFEKANSSANSDITIRAAKNNEIAGNGLLSFTEIPYGYSAGKTIIINKNYYQYNSVSINRFTYHLVHSLGHAVGFSHSGATDDNSSVANNAIPGTGSDYDGFMYWGHNLLSDWLGWITPDITAVKAVYGNNKEDPSKGTTKPPTKPDLNNPDYAEATSLYWTKTGDLSGEFTVKSTFYSDPDFIKKYTIFSVDFKCPGATITGGDLEYTKQISVPKDGIYTISYRVVFGTTVRAFYVEGSNTVQITRYEGQLAPIVQFYNGKIQDHLYTNYQNEVMGNPSWAYEGVFGYVFKYLMPRTVPLYRSYSGKNQDHMMTVDNKEAVCVPYVCESILGYVYKDTGNKRHPVYRHYLSDKNGLDHYYTTQNISVPNYYYEGRCFYMPTL